MDAGSFVKDIKELFEKEQGYTEAGLTPEAQLLERQALVTNEIMIWIRSRLDSELAKAPEFRSQHFSEALNYLGKFWKELFAFLDEEGFR